MSYCDIGDVRALNPKRSYDMKSTPTSVQVEDYITKIGNEIDSALSARGLAVPVTAPSQFVGSLGQLNACGAAALAEMAMFPEAGGPGATSHGSELWRIYKDGIARLERGELPVSLEKGGGPTSYFEQNPDESPPKFGKDKVF